MMAKTSYWLMKSEPDVYPFERLVKDKLTAWEGVRNFEARNNLRAMAVGDLALFYHSNIGKEIVGVMRVVKAAYPDPSAKGEDWSVVDVAPVKAISAPITLAAIKADEALADLQLLKRSRLSVVPVSPAHFKHLLALGKTKL
jgi:predicted RNA-binding protein with PUA-like domain